MTARAYGILTAAFFTIFIAYAIRYGYGLLLPEMLPALGISKTQAGIIYSSYFLAYTLFSPILGLISDRYDMRRLLTAFTALLGAGAFFMAYAKSVWGASIFFTLAGIGHAACWAPVMALVQRWVPEQRRGAALGFTSLGGGVGMAAWSMLLPFIVERFGWKTGWISMGLFSFLVAVLNFLLVRSHPPTAVADRRSSGESHPVRAERHPYRWLLKDSRLWIIGMSYLMVGFAVLVPYTYLGAYAVEVRGLPFRIAARFITAIAAAGIIGKLTLAVGSDHLGRIRVMMLCNLLMAVGCAAMMAGPGTWGLYGASLLFGLGFGAVWPVYAAAAPDYFPTAAAGSVIGLWTVFLGLGSIVSPILCGWTIDLTRDYQWAFLLGMINALAAALILLPALKDGRVTRQTIEP